MLSYCYVLRSDFFHRSSCSSPSVQYVLWIDCSRFRPPFAQEAPNYWLRAAWGIPLSLSGCDDALYIREVENGTPGHSGSFPDTLQTSSSQTVCQKLSSVEALLRFLCCLLFFLIEGFFLSILRSCWVTVKSHCSAMSPAPGPCSVLFVQEFCMWCSPAPASFFCLPSLNPFMHLFLFTLNYIGETLEGDKRMFPIVT